MQMAVLFVVLPAAGERTVEGGVDYFPSVRAGDWAGPRAEVRVGVLQRLRATGATEAEPLVADVADGSPVAFDVTVGDGGRAVVMACDYPCDLDFWRTLLGRTGVRRRLVADGAGPGLVATTTADAAGQRLVHLVNVATVPQRFTLDLDGVPVAGGAEIALGVRRGRILPLDVRLDDAVLRWSTAELDGAGDGSTVLLRRGEEAGSALLETAREVAVDGVSGAEATRTASGSWLVSWPGGADGEQLRVRLA
jgi:beta-galactosidase